MSIEQRLERFANLGRINISFNPAFHNYRISILSITVVSEGIFLPCKVEALSIDEATIELDTLLTSANKLIYGRFSDEEKVVNYCPEENKLAM